MAEHVVHTQLPGQLVMLGCGSIGQAVLPLILRHLGVTPDRITIVTADARGREEAGAVRHRLPREGADPGQLSPRARAAGRRGRLPAQPVGRRQQHRDRRASPTSAARSTSTPCIEPWGGGYFDRSLSPAARSNYALRESMLQLRRELGRGPTAVIAQGANPGLVSQFVKEAVLIVARDTGLPHAEPTDRAGLGAAVPRPRRQGDPHRRARHPGRRASPSGRASSSTPGRSTASSPRAASRPSWAGARTSGTSRAAACATPSAAARRST